jgi:hypothetical protein
MNIMQIFLESHHKSMKFLYTRSKINSKRSHENVTFNKLVSVIYLGHILRICPKMAIRDWIKTF